MRSAEEHVGQSFYPHECGSMIECVTRQDAIKAIREAQREAIKEAAESADLRDGCYDEGCHCNSDPKKQSILSLLNQIQ